MSTYDVAAVVESPPPDLVESVVQLFSLSERKWPAWGGEGPPAPICSHLRDTRVRSGWCTCRTPEHRTRQRMEFLYVIHLLVSAQSPMFLSMQEGMLGFCAVCDVVNLS